jgi:hypothetical protein
VSAPTTGAALVASPVLVQVVTTAGHRCECVGKGCHGKSARCARTMPGHRLVAAPRDVTTPEHAAWRLPVRELAAWCQRCHDHAMAEARRARQAGLRAELLGDLALFDVPADVPVGAGAVAGGAR